MWPRVTTRRVCVASPSLSCVALTRCKREVWWPRLSSRLHATTLHTHDNNNNNNDDRMRHAASAAADAAATATTRTSQVFAPRVRLDAVLYDKETTRYRGTVFGLPADMVVFYGKLCAGVTVVLLVCYVFVRGYVLLAQFSLQTVARLGFGAGFVSCMVLYTLALALVRRSRISANAVYNQSIAMVMRNDTVQRFLGAHPRTGEFRAYSATGGVKLPLLRRVRSGAYTLADLLGTKPRRLQMLFVLKNTSNTHEGLVACDVRRERAGLLRSTVVYRSLSVTLSDAATRTRVETVILIGAPEDVVQSTLLW